MPLTILSLAPVAVLHFALQDFTARNGHDFLRGFAEVFKRRWFGFWHAIRYALSRMSAILVYCATGSNDESFSEISKVSAFSIFPLTRKRCVLSVSRKCSLPFKGTSQYTRTSTKGDFSVYVKKTSIFSLLLSRVAWKKNSVQSTGRSTNAFAVSSLSNSSRLIFSTICFGVNLYEGDSLRFGTPRVFGIVGEGERTTVGVAVAAVVGVGVGVKKDSGVFCTSRFDALSSNQQTDPITAQIIATAVKIFLLLQ